MRRPVETKSEIAQLADAAKAAGIQPHAMRITCDDYARIAPQGKDVDVARDARPHDARARPDRARGGRRIATRSPSHRPWIARLRRRAPQRSVPRQGRRGLELRRRRSTTLTQQPLRRDRPDRPRARRGRPASAEAAVVPLWSSTPIDGPGVQARRALVRRDPPRGHDPRSRRSRGWAVCALVQAVLWLVAQRTKNAGIVDVGWALTFTLVVALFARVVAPASWPPIAVVVDRVERCGSAAISSRAARRRAPRKAATPICARAGRRTRAAKFFVFFQAQAALTGDPVDRVRRAVRRAPCGRRRWLRALGASSRRSASLGETIADAQLARFKRDDHKGRVCDVGLWSWSRHPNYFFEWCVWIGLCGVWSRVRAVGPDRARCRRRSSSRASSASRAFHRRRIKLCAARARRIAQYQQRVSRFVPMPPKRARPSA